MPGASSPLLAAEHATASRPWMPVQVLRPSGTPTPTTPLVHSQSTVVRFMPEAALPPLAIYPQDFFQSLRSNS